MKRETAIVNKSSIWEVGCNYTLQSPNGNVKYTIHVRRFTFHEADG